jgi:pathogenesis-related protein 1
LFTGTAGFFTVDKGVQAWLDEKKFYNGEPIGGANFSQVGHYTQAVWKGTTEVGGAKVICNGMMILVFNYDPPGNMIGEKPY